MQPWDQITRVSVEDMVDKKANRWHEHHNYEAAITQLQNLYDQVLRENQELKARLDNLELVVRNDKLDLMEHLGSHRLEGIENGESDNALQINN